ARTPTDGRSRKAYPAADRVNRRTNPEHTRPGSTGSPAGSLVLLPQPVVELLGRAVVRRQGLAAPLGRLLEGQILGVPQREEFARVVGRRGGEVADFPAPRRRHLRPGGVGDRAGVFDLPPAPLARLAPPPEVGEAVLDHPPQVGFGVAAGR